MECRASRRIGAARHMRAYANARESTFTRGPTAASPGSFWAQRTVIAIYLITCNPAAGNCGVECPFEHPTCELRLRGKPGRFRNARSRAAGPIIDPRLWHIQLPVNEYAAAVARVTQEHTDLAILNTAGRATILALNAHGVFSLLQEACLVDDQYGITLPRFFDDVVAKGVASRVGIPLSPPLKQVLYAIWCGLTNPFCELPAILVFDGTQ